MKDKSGNKKNHTKDGILFIYWYRRIDRYEFKKKKLFFYG
jgi:hypothetical protein